MNSDKQYLSGIDLVKCVAAVAVVMIHAGFFYSFHGPFDKFFINALCRWAVPFFFLVSGYFMHDSGRAMLQYLVRLFVLNFVWSLAYILLLGYPLPASLTQIFPVNNIVPPFWYFPSLMVCVLLTFLLKRLFRGNYTLLLGFAFVCYLLALSGDAYYNLAPSHLVYRLNDALWGFGTRNGFLFGLWFVCLGHFFRHTNRLQTIADRLSLRSASGLVLLGFAAATVEARLYKIFTPGVDFNVTITSLFLAPCILVLAMKLRVERQFSLLLRRLSVLVYLTHWYYTQLFRLEIITNSILRFFLILGASLLTSLVIAAAARRFRPLRWLC